MMMMIILWQKPWKALVRALKRSLFPLFPFTEERESEL